ncbi:MAG: homoserine dehydrogenase, partial [Clostridia bacterium]|nr:homoserine dehydrogenase [Clostridia bacterium]
MVAPFVIKKSSPLYSVNDVFNGILVRGDALGDAMFYGRGAGKLPTASAAVADIIDGMKHMHARKYLCWEETEPSDMEIIIEQHENCEFSYLVRAEGIEEASVYTAFGECGVKKAKAQADIR